LKPSKGPLKKFFIFPDRAAFSAVKTVMPAHEYSFIFAALFGISLAVESRRSIEKLISNHRPKIMSKKYLWLAGAVFCGLFTCVHSVFANGVRGTNVLTIQTVVTTGGMVWGSFDDPDNSFTLDAGSNPESVIAADVNGDGKMDLICANGDDVLKVYTNNGSGGFVLASSPSVGIDPYGVVAADVNGDGKMDLINVNYGNNTLTVLTNKGNGLFGSNATYSVGSHPFSVAAADVNGDGHVDLICANAGSTINPGNTLTVLTNKGNGLFGSNATYTVGNGPRCVIAADIKGDGKMALISANYYDNTLTVLTNNYNNIGHFGSNAAYSVGSYPRCVIAADVNGDGHVDLISANEGDDTLTVLTNNGSGGFVLASTLDVGGGPKSVVAADVNGDGKVDLISANGQDNTLSVLINDGRGGFVPGSTPAVGGTPISVTAADVNGDGHVDLICANYDDNTLTIWLNTPTSSGFLNGVAISWSTNATGFVLQQNGDLGTTNWVNVSTTPTVTNQQNQVIAAPLVDSQFYRLRHP
jgi:hypothetical protein